MKGGTRILKSTWILVLLLALTLSSFAADVSSTFDSANKLYEQGKFTEAVAA